METPQLHVETFVEPSFGENAYLLWAVRGGECWIVDPGLPPQPDQIIDRASRLSLRPAAILLTHGHADHIAGVGPLRRCWPDVPVYIGRPDQGMLSDPQENLSAEFGVPFTTGVVDAVALEPQQEMKLTGIPWEVLDTSGHSPGGRSLHCPSQKLVIVGDALFAGSIGRTDLPGSDGRQLVANLQRYLLPLPDETRVLAGHGPETTIGNERLTNPFLGQRI
jgi:glyoxylase-like metal-dependent hydrolase (beta-lactamase superfamily II)